jgi:competence protein ComEA
MKDLFTFTKKEQRGILLLLTVILILIGVRIYQNFLFNNIPPISVEEFYPEFSENTLEVEVKGDVKPANTLLPFNPNTLDSEGWQALGLSKKQAQSILNFRNAGAVFYKKEDLKKLFVISEEFYEKIEPFVEIEVKKEVAKEFKKAPRPKIMDINSADSLALVSISGIGPTFAKRILAYRAILGGFTSKTQLLEVYGIDEDKLSELESKITIGPIPETAKININEANYIELVKHPFISKSIAKSIVAYREQHGIFADKSELLLITTISKETYDRISPHIRH